MSAEHPQAPFPTSVLHIRVDRRVKALWVKAAERQGRKLAEWVTEKLSEAADKEFDFTQGNQEKQKPQ